MRKNRRKKKTRMRTDKNIEKKEQKKQKAKDRTRLANCQKTAAIALQICRLKKAVKRQTKKETFSFH